MNNIKQYAKLLKKAKALKAIMDDMHETVLRELRKSADGKVEIDGVSFHTTNKVTVKYAKDIADVIKNLNGQIDAQKIMAKDAGKYTESVTATFDAEIPKASAETLLAEVPEYRKYFGVK